MVWIAQADREVYRLRQHRTHFHFASIAAASRCSSVAPNDWIRADAEPSTCRVPGLARLQRQKLCPVGVVVEHRNLLGSSGARSAASIKPLREGAPSVNVRFFAPARQFVPAQGNVTCARARAPAGRLVRTNPVSSSSKLACPLSKCTAKTHQQAFQLAQRSAGIHIAQAQPLLHILVEVLQQHLAALSMASEISPARSSCSCSKAV